MQQAAQHHPQVAHEHKTFKRSYVSIGSTVRMVAAGMLIEKLNMRSPLERALIFAATGAALGYVENLLRERKDAKAEGRLRTRERR